MVRNLKKLIAVLIVSGGVGCLGTAPQQAPVSNDPANPTTPADPAAGSGPTVGNGAGAADTNNPASTGTGGGMDTTFDHDLEQADPFAVLARIQEQGPPEISTRMHSCEKMKYVTVGNVLAQLGVNMASTTTNSAGLLYKNGGSALGMPNYSARVPEAIENSTAGVTKLFDIFVAAAPEIVKAMPTNASCKLAGAATSMFDASGQCTEAGIACLQGTPAIPGQLDLCNNVLASASTSAIGQAIAVATILSSAHTCE
jgi:hypothetical protein